jgi:hypothetical protein
MTVVTLKSKIEVLRSRSRIEPKLLAGAGVGAGMKFRLWFPALGPGQNS